MVYYNLLSIFRALICPSSGARDYTCDITPHMVCNALVAGGRRSGAGQQTVRVEQIIIAIKHSVASSWFSSLRTDNDAWTNIHQT